MGAETRGPACFITPVRGISKRAYQLRGNVRTSQQEDTPVSSAPEPVGGTQPAGLQPASTDPEQHLQHIPRHPAKHPIHHGLFHTRPLTMATQTGAPWE